MQGLWEGVTGQGEQFSGMGLAPYEKRALFLLPPIRGQWLSPEGHHADCTQTFLNCEKWVSVLQKPLSLW